MASKRTGYGQNTKPTSSIGAHEAGLRPSDPIVMPMPPNGCTCRWDMHGSHEGEYYFTLKFRNASCPVRKEHG